MEYPERSQPNTRKLKLLGRAALAVTGLGIGILSYELAKHVNNEETAYISPALYLVGATTTLCAFIPAEKNRGKGDDQGGRGGGGGGGEPPVEPNPKGPGGIPATPEWIIEVEDFLKDKVLVSR